MSVAPFITNFGLSEFDTEVEVHRMSNHILSCTLLEETSNYISSSGMNIWLKVRQQSWMILFLLIHISTSYTCHQHYPVQKGQDDLKYLQIIILYIAETLKMVLGVTWIMLDILNVSITSKM